MTENLIAGLRIHSTSIRGYSSSTLGPVLLKRLMFFLQLDDRIFNDSIGTLLVASLDLCLDWLWFCRSRYRFECPSWCCLSCHLPCCGTNQFWYLRKSLVHIQQ